MRWPGAGAAGPTAADDAAWSWGAESCCCCCCWGVRSHHSCKVGACCGCLWCRRGGEGGGRRCVKKGLEADTLKSRCH